LIGTVRPGTLATHDVARAGHIARAGEGLRPVVEDVRSCLRIGDSDGYQGHIDRTRGDSPAVEAVPQWLHLNGRVGKTPTQNHLSHINTAITLALPHEAIA
jgi:hypothetical protein